MKIYRFIIYLTGIVFIQRSLCDGASWISLCVWVWVSVPVSDSLNRSKQLREESFSNGHLWKVVRKDRKKDLFWLCAIKSLFEYKIPFTPCARTIDMCTYVQYQMLRGLPSGHLYRVHIEFENMIFHLDGKMVVICSKARTHNRRDGKRTKVNWLRTNE